MYVGKKKTLGPRGRALVAPLFSLDQKNTTYVVNDKQEAVLLSELNQLEHRGEVSFHTEQAREHSERREEEGSLSLRTCKHGEELTEAIMFGGNGGWIGTCPCKHGEQLTEIKFFDIPY